MNLDKKSNKTNYLLFHSIKLIVLHQMKTKIYSSIFCLLLCFSYSQNPKITENLALNEAQKRNISTTDEVIKELNKNGISLSQAQEMAKMQGMDFNTFLSQNFDLNIQNNNQVKNTNESTISSIEYVDNPNLLNPDQLDKNEKVNEFMEEYFGYSIFKNNPFADKQYLVGNIDEGYLLSPGDELRITVFGNNALTTQTKIDLNGNIIFPDLGVFQAAGNSLKSIKSRLKLFLGKFYNGLISTPQKTFLDISLTQIRPVKVNVLGEALTPGPHLVNGLASVLNAIYSAGGIKTSGSLRKVLLFRNNKLLKEFDLYDYITQGNIDSDVRLMSSDVIFIPPRISSVTLSGEVNNSSIYEIKNGETLEDLITFSGGLSTNASLSNINISRTVPFNDRGESQVYDKFLLTVSYNDKKNIKLINGDVIFFPKILSKIKDQVKIEGNIKLSGTYSVSRFPDLKSLINLGAKGISENTYMKKVDVFKTDSSGKKSFNTYNLNSILSDEILVKLEQDDVVRVYSNNEIQGEKLITVSGFGVENKTIFWRENLSAFDVIFQSTSFEELEYQSNLLNSRFDIDSFNADTGAYQTNIYSLKDLIKLKQIILKPKDIIRLYSRQITKNTEPSVLISGSVNNPIRTDLFSNMVVEDAILRAGGFQMFADQDEVNIIRKLKFSEDQKLSENIKYKIDKDYLLGLTKKPKSPFYLIDNDVVVVKTPNRDDVNGYISLEGEVNYPGLYSIEDIDLNLEELIARAGGLTEFANLNSTQLYRDEKLLSFSRLSVLKNQKIASNDRIIIGSNLDEIEIVGSGIVNPTFNSWKNGKRARYYINLAGGKTNKIESKTVIRKNGSSIKIKTFFGNPKIYPGDTIRIIKKPEEEKSEKNFGDEFIKIFGFVSSAITTILLINRL